MHPERVGPYLIERKIGAGGMGTVYFAHHAETAREAAVKVLPPSLAREGGFLARFTREIDAMKQLVNPHVVQLYDSGVDGETYYYAMEYVEGETLTQKLRRETRLPWRDAVEIAIQICSALKAAHDAGIIHRDLKPSNLLIDKSGLVKLTDFGVAQVFASGKLTITGGIIGTAEYMSPEQAQGQRATKKSDLYSLGAVMYVMLTGQPPFRGKTTLEVIQKHKFGQYDKPSRYVDDLPRWVEEVVAQLLEKDPEKRPPDAYVLSRRLQDALHHFDSLQSELTVATGEVIDPGAPTVAATGPVGGQDAGVGTLMRDLVRAEIEESQRPSTVERLLNNTWVLLALFAMVVAGGVALFRSQQLSPEEQFQAGVELMSEPEGDNWLRARSEYFQPLVEADADRWQDKVEPHLQRIRAYELKARLSGGRRRVAGGAVPPSEPERFLGLAGHYREIGDLARAEEVLVALTALLDGADDHTDFYAVAQEQLEQIRAERTQRGRHDEFLMSILERADRLAANGRRDDAAHIWESIVELYGTDAAAEEHVRQARSRLAGN